MYGLTIVILLFFGYFVVAFFLFSSLAHFCDRSQLPAGMAFTISSWNRPFLRFSSGIRNVYLFWKSSEVAAFSSHGSRECPHLVPVHPALNIYAVIAKLLDPWMIITQR